MVEEILERAKENIEVHKLSTSPAINCLCYPQHQGILYKDLYLIEFENMYPNILTQMFNQHILDKNEEHNINKIKHYLENKDEMKSNLSKDDIRAVKTEVNSYFGNLYRRDKTKTDLLQQYVHEIYNELYSPETGITNRDEILYVDTDQFFMRKRPCYNTTKVLDSLNIPYTINNIDYAYFKGKKYLAYTDPYGVVKSKYSRSTGDGKLIKEMEDKIKSIRREERLNEILK